MKLWNAFTREGNFAGVVGSDEQDHSPEVVAWSQTHVNPLIFRVEPVMHVKQREVKTNAQKPATDTGFILETRKFLKDLLDRDMFHYAVTDEVRREARRLLGDEVKK